MTLVFGEAGRDKTALRQVGFSARGQWARLRRTGRFQCARLCNLE